jgi:transcriptional regulator with PAS, ATPase and Fis domain
MEPQLSPVSRASVRPQAAAPDVLCHLSTGPVVGRSPRLRSLFGQVERVASTPRTTVLIGGASGSGKELVARAVHELSARAGRPFVAVNCAALAETLLEAELFGYEPGAFTGGSARGHAGLIAAAEGGTLLLDEVGELRPALQAKLLRVLQERSYRRVGGTADRDMDVRVIASTNRDLVAMVEAGTFREDLFYRLNVMSLRVPGLAERAEDLPVLATHFLARCGREFGTSFRGFAPQAMARLRGHPWPGNVRELANVVERAALLAGGGWIEGEHLELTRPGGEAGAEGGAGAGPGDTLPLGDRSLRSVEEALIRRVLAETDGNRSRSARILGINRTTLYSKLRAYGI